MSDAQSFEHNTPGLKEAEALLAARASALDARYRGHLGCQQAWFPLIGGGRAVYVTYTANGIKEPGQSYGSLAPTPLDVAKGWIAIIETHLDGSVGTLFWRVRPTIRLLPAVSFDDARKYAREMSPAGWAASARMVIAEGEPGFSQNDLAHCPEDYPEPILADMAEARARYFAARAAI